jgi:hypothetical protein
VIVTLTTGQVIIPSGQIVHQEKYRPCDSNTDYWAGNNTIRTNSPPGEVSTM